MKKQFNIGNKNTQISDDDTTSQVQIGFNRVWVTGIIIGIIGYCIISYIVEP